MTKEVQRFERRRFVTETGTLEKSTGAKDLYVVEVSLDRAFLLVETRTCTLMNYKDPEKAYLTSPSSSALTHSYVEAAEQMYEQKCKDFLNATVYKYAEVPVSSVLDEGVVFSLVSEEFIQQAKDRILQAEKDRAAAALKKQKEIEDLKLQSDPLYLDFGD